MTLLPSPPEVDLPCKVPCKVVLNPCHVKPIRLSRTQGLLSWLHEEESDVCTLAKLNLFLPTCSTKHWRVCSTTSVALESKVHTYSVVPGPWDSMQACTPWPPTERLKEYTLADYDLDTSKVAC
eukprot:1318532-Amphidinium_carterae.1